MAHLDSGAPVASSLICCLSAAQPAPSPAALDIGKIQEVTGLKGTFSKEENVFKVSKPRQ
jgi:hypothetical protein